MGDKNGSSVTHVTVGAPTPGESSSRSTAPEWLKVLVAILAALGIGVGGGGYAASRNGQDRAEEAAAWKQHVTDELDAIHKELNELHVFIIPQPLPQSPRR